MPAQIIPAVFVLILESYFENVWDWIADHDIDDPANTQVDVYGCRGMALPSGLFGESSADIVRYTYYE